MKKAIIIVFVFVGISIGLVAFFSPAPPLEEFLPYVGKTEEELRNQLGPPDGYAVRFIACPDGLSDEEYEKYHEVTVSYISRYGYIMVEMNTHSKILNVYKSSKRKIEFPDERNEITE